MPSSLPARPLLAASALAAGIAVAVGLSRLPTRRLVLAGTGILGLGTAVLLAGGPLSEGLDSIRRPRLSVSSPDRVQETAAALRSVAQRPIAGTGPGRLILAWQSPDGTTSVARWAHNEYLQVLGELGVVGLLALGAFMGSLGRVVWLGRTSSPSVEIWAGLVAGLLALAVHSSFDFLWHVPAIPLMAALLIGLTTPSAAQEAT